MWVCESCTLKNAPRRRRCEACGGRPPSVDRTDTRGVGTNASEQSESETRSSNTNIPDDTPSVTSRDSNGSAPMNRTKRKRKTSVVAGWLRRNQQKRDQAILAESSTTCDDSIIQVDDPVLTAFMDQRDVMVRLIGCGGATNDKEMNTPPISAASSAASDASNVDAQPLRLEAVLQLRTVTVHLTGYDLDDASHQDVSSVDGSPIHATDSDWTVTQAQESQLISNDHSGDQAWSEMGYNHEYDTEPAGSVPSETVLKPSPLAALASRAVESTCVPPTDPVKHGSPQSGCLVELPMPLVAPDTSSVDKTMRRCAYDGGGSSPNEAISSEHCAEEEVNIPLETCVDKLAVEAPNRGEPPNLTLPQHSLATACCLSPTICVPGKQDVIANVGSEALQQPAGDQNPDGGPMDTTDLDIAAIDCSNVVSRSGTCLTSCSKAVSCVPDGVGFTPQMPNPIQPETRSGQAPLKPSDLHAFFYTPVTTQPQTSQSQASQTDVPTNCAHPPKQSPCLPGAVLTQEGRPASPIRNPTGTLPSSVAIGGTFAPKRSGESRELESRQLAMGPRACLETNTPNGLRTMNSHSLDDLDCPPGVAQTANESIVSTEVDVHASVRLEGSPLSEPYRLQCGSTTVQLDGASFGGYEASLAGYEAAPIGKMSLTPLFQTAGRGHMVVVSKESLAKASSILDQCLVLDGDLPTTIPPNRRDDIVSVVDTQVNNVEQTVKGSTVVRHSDCRAPNEGTEDAGSPQQKTGSSDICSGLPRLVGFRTSGNGDIVAISADGMAKAKAMLEGEKVNVHVTLNASSSSMVQEQISQLLPISCENPLQPCSSEALSKALTTIDSSTSEERGVARSKVQSKEHRMPCSPIAKDNVTLAIPRQEALSSPKTSIVASFQTAGKGRTLVVSEESLGKAGALLKQSPDPGPRQMSGAVAVGTSRRNDAIRSPNFIASTEGNEYGGSVKRSAAVPPFEAAANGSKKARLFPVLCNKPPVRSNSLDASSEASMVVGFRTSGKEALLTVSAENMAKAQFILDNESGNGDENTVLYAKKAAVSSERQISKPLDCDDSKLRPNSDNDGSVVTRVLGFRTSGMGALVTVSADSMAKAASILEGDITCGTTDLGSVERTAVKAPPSPVLRKTLPVQALSDHARLEVPRLVGFRTARKGAIVSVTTESMARAESILKGDAVNGITMEGTSNATSSSTLEALQALDTELSRETIVSEVGHLSPNPDSVARKLNDSAVAFTTAGRKSVVSVTAEAMVKANADDSGKTVKRYEDEDNAPSLNGANAESEVQSSLPASSGQSLHFQEDGNASRLDCSPETHPVGRCGRNTLSPASCTGHCDSSSLSLQYTVNLSERASSDVQDTCQHDVMNRVSVSPNRLIETAVVPQDHSFGPNTGGESRQPRRSMQRDGLATAPEPTCGEGASNSLLNRSQQSLKVHSPSSNHTSTCGGRVITPGTMLSNCGAELVLLSTTEGIHPFDNPSVDLSMDFKANATSETFRDALAHGDMTSCPLECSHFGVSDVTMQVNSENAVNVRFDQITSLPVSIQGDNANHRGSISDFMDALFEAGCSVKLTSTKWVGTHVRWINWKLASMERKFAPFLAGRYFTFQAVVKQLLHRYKVEIRNGSRPILRKLLNRDVSATSMMILCVASIKLNKDDTSGKLDESNFTMELTDGWYSIPAAPDSALSELVTKGTIRVGTKLLVSNAVMTGFDDGIDPLDHRFDPFKTSCSPVLHVTANSTRLARWNAKLGRVPMTPSIASHDGLLRVKKIADVRDGGGRIPLIDLRILRKYPLLFLDRKDNTSDGKSRVLSEKDENARLETHEKRRIDIVDRLSEEIQAECEADVDEDAPEVWLRFKKDTSSDFFDGLGDSDKAEMVRWQARRSLLLQKRVQDEIDAKLEELECQLEPSVPFLKVLATNCADYPCDDPTSEQALLTIWRPSSSQLDCIQEGSLLRVKNLETKGGRFGGILQLSGGSKTPITGVPHSIYSLPSMDDLSSRGFVTMFRTHLMSRSLWKDTVPDRSNVCFDLLGVVLHVQELEQNHGWKVYLTDESLLLHCALFYGDRPPCLIALPTFEGTSNPTVAAVLNLRAEPFDFAEYCSLAQFNDRSQIHLNPTFHQATLLEQWARSDAGRRKLRKRLLYMNVGVQELATSDLIFPNAIGYISGFQYLHTHSHLLLEVDCGGPLVETFKLPLALIPSLATLCPDVEECVALNLAEENRLSKLASIGRLFRARHILFTFALQTISTELMDFPECKYEVSHVSAADTSALAALYSSLIRNDPSA